MSKLFRFLPKHPLAMQTIFKHCYLVNFSMEPLTLKKLLPDPIEPDIYDNKAYLSVVIADLNDMRPNIFPKIFGHNFTQIVYRAVVINPQNDNEKGVHFLRSDADDNFMCLTGNMFSFFNFKYSKNISWKLRFKDDQVSHTQFKCLTPDKLGAIEASFVHDSEIAHTMPESSSFDDINEAKSFFVERYMACTANKKSVFSVRIQRSEWNVVNVVDKIGKYQFMDDSPMFPKGSTKLDSIFYVKDLYYYWYTLDKQPKKQVKNEVKEKAKKEV